MGSFQHDRHSDTPGVSRPRPRRPYARPYGSRLSKLDEALGIVEVYQDLSIARRT
jgi:hypothetical protein